MLKGRSGLHPFFDLDSVDEGRWTAAPLPAASNHMAGIHGAAMCLLATEIADRAFSEATGSSLSAHSLSAVFISQADNRIEVTAEVRQQPGAAFVSVTFESAGRRCFVAHILGVPRPLQDRYVDLDSAPEFEGSSLAPTDVPFRVAAGVEVSQDALGVFARWLPTAYMARFMSTGNRVLGLVALLVDTGGTLVNSDEAGRLVANYATTSISASVLNREATYEGGTARVSELGNGRRVRFTSSTLFDSEGAQFGQGIAQFVALRKGGST